MFAQGCEIDFDFRRAIVRPATNFIGYVATPLLAGVVVGVDDHELVCQRQHRQLVGHVRQPLAHDFGDTFGHGDRDNL